MVVAPSVPSPSEPRFGLAAVMDGCSRYASDTGARPPIAEQQPEKRRHTSAVGAEQFDRRRGHREDQAIERRHPFVDFVQPAGVDCRWCR